MKRFYKLQMYQRIQGQVIEICAVETSLLLTRKRDAQREANRYNRKRGLSYPEKWVAPAIL